MLKSRLVELCAALALAVLGVLLFARARGLIDPIVRVGDGAVGVRVDYLTGDLSGPVSPGYTGSFPLLQEVVLLQREPRELLMEGTEFADTWHVPRLLVRARDGSTFWFDRVSVQTALDTSAVAQALTDTGIDDTLRAALIHSGARAVLREELGRLTAPEVVLPDRRRAAVESARVRLAAALAPHAVRVFEVALSKPSFDPRWEQTIERRKVAEQRIDELEREAQLMLDAESSTNANLRLQLDLQLEKSRLINQRLLEDLVLEGQRLEEGRSMGLVDLRTEHEERMATDTAKWTAALAELDLELERLEASRAPRLAGVDAAQAAQLAHARSEWELREQALGRELTRVQGLLPELLDSVRETSEFERARERATQQAGAAAARQEVREMLSQADAEYADALGKATLQRDSDLALAEALRESYAAEVESFRAETEALAQAGLSAVRAALIEGLAGVRMELVPREPETATLAHGAQR